MAFAGSSSPPNMKKNCLKIHYVPNYYASPTFWVISKNNVQMTLKLHIIIHVIIDYTNIDWVRGHQCKLFALRELG